MRLFSALSRENDKISLKAIIKAFIGIIWYWSGLVYLLRRYQKRKVVILSFHRIETKHDFFDMCISPRVFKKYFNYLRKHYNFISLSDYVRRLKAGKSPIANSVVITFDDGYASIYQEAFPLLKRYRAPATLFLVGNWLENGGIPWWDQVENAFRAEMEQASRESDKKFSHRFWRETCKTFVEKVRCLPVSQRVQEMEALKHRLRDVELIDSPKLISKEMARELVQHQVELGNHTYSHAALVGEKPEIQRAELERCEAVLSRFSKREFKSFSYPYGFTCHMTTSPGLESVLKELGFDCALTNVFGLNGPDSNPYKLKRYQPGEEILAVFASELAGVFDILRRLEAQLQSRQIFNSFGEICLRCLHAIRR